MKRTSEVSLNVGLQVPFPFACDVSSFRRIGVGVCPSLNIYLDTPSLLYYPWTVFSGHKDSRFIKFCIILLFS